jgi:hypothetical protein
MKHDKIVQINREEYILRKFTNIYYSKEKICQYPDLNLTSLPDYLGAFTKSLFHDNEGKVNKCDYKILLKGLAGELHCINEVKYAGNLRLINPSCIYSLDLVGPYKSTTCIGPNPSFTSAEVASEMGELYAMALMRDVPFSDYSNYQNICESLNQFTNFKGPKIDGHVTPQTLFRGNSSGDLKGLYISQFLYYSFTQGPMECNQKYKCYNENQDFMTTWEQALSVQNGIVTQTVVRDLHRYIITLRDGITYVHYDNPFSPCYNTANILYSLNCPGPKGSPFSFNKLKEKSFIDMASMDVFDLLGRASRIAMLTTWYNKWSILRLRPEAYGMEVQKAKTISNQYHINDELINSNLLTQIFDKFGSYLLPQAYPEGSPCHPAYPAGHATFMGAMVTILKAYFDEDFEFDAYGPNEDGSELIKLDYKVKVGDELNKVASNIANFRNASGVHYRSDAKGIKIGESVAIQILQEHIERYPYKTTFSFHKFNGEKVCISN